MALSLQGQAVTLGDLAESLLILEPMCAAACADRADRAETLVPALRASLEETERAVGHGEEFSMAARTFHDLMVSGSPNPTMRLLVRTLVAIWSIQEETWAATVNAAQQYPEESAQRDALHAHQVLLRHIEDGDADGASRAAAKHLRASQAIVLERFAGEVVDSSSLAAVQAFKSL
jgi:GntR family transcriptional regulator, transcriptional repressor for pyruvate dehydrogenase complex